MKRAIVLLIAIVVACTSLPNKTASLQGTVVDRQGTPIPGVTVTAGTQTVVTDAKGHYEFANLPTGKYVVIAKLEGFNESRLRISVNGKPIRHDIAISSSVSESITVSAEAPSSFLGAVVGGIIGARAKSAPVALPAGVPVR